MGGGNGCKSQNRQKRKAALRNKKSGNGQSTHSKEFQRNACTFQCVICRQTFMNTSSESILRDHCSAKHSGKNGRTFEQCFPMYGSKSGSKTSATDSSSATVYKSYEVYNKNKKSYNNNSNNNNGGQKKQKKKNKRRKK